MKYMLVVAAISVLSSPTASAAEANSVDGRRLFAEHCAACHGKNAEGDGPSASELQTQPADLTKISERRGGVWPLLEVMSIIDGYTKRFVPREGMPVIEKLNDGPLVSFDTGNGFDTPVPANLIALANYLESIQSPRPKRYVP